MWTGSWRDPASAAVQAGVRPENELTGQLFTVNTGTTSIQVPASYHNLPFWRHTSWRASRRRVAELAAGTLGYEWDSDTDDGLPRPPRPARPFTQPDR